MKSVLIVDDDKNILSVLGRLLRSARYELTLCQDPVEALALCQDKRYSLIISDQKMPVMTGTQLFEKIAGLQIRASKIILSGYSDFNEITHAFNQQWINQFIAKPWDDETLQSIVDTTVASVTTGDELALQDTDKADAYGLHNFHGLLSANAVFNKLFSKVKRAAISGTSVYLYGETGTGKELFAQAIHNESPMAAGPFIAVNCANFNEQLIESQLFGHVKGAFTGADFNQEGLLAAACGGTLFLDEITTLPPAMQSKMLRVIQEKEYMPVGSTEKKSFDATVISASNKHLSIAVSDGEFREDLYYRLCVIPLPIPPLRRRGDDALRLFEYFIDQLSASKYLGYDGVKDTLLTYHWPGNVRQLINVCQYVVAMSEGDEISLADLPEDIAVNPGYDSTKTSVEVIELTEQSIRGALTENNNNKSAAARALGVSRMTLWRRVKDFNIE